MGEYTIVVPDNNIISCVCGTNDSNLRLIEENLGVSVFTRGNELSIPSDDKETCEKFQFIIDRIVDEINDGGMNSEDVVLSVLNTQRKVNAEEVSISVIGAVKKIYIFCLMLCSRIDFFYCARNCNGNFVCINLSLSV